MLRRRANLSVILAATLLLAACGAPAEDEPLSHGVDPQAAEGVVVSVHKTESCECCGEYERYLEAVGFTVEQVVHDDLADIKTAFGVPDDERSCHTNEVAGYAAEGHVPAEALLELIEKSPDVDGISLAGMPAGSPGMPGEQAAPFVVRSFIDAEVVAEFGQY